MAKRRVMGRIEAALSAPGTGPTIRRYFVNTMFDSTSVMLGIIVGSAFSSHPNISVVISTIVVSAVALGISTGVSVFEAESIEQSRRIDEIEKAMLRSLEGTHIEKVSKWSIVIIAFINFLAPLTSGIVTVSPFAFLPELGIQTDAWIGVGLSIFLLFLTGFFMGRNRGRNPLVQAIRMAVVGLAVFVVCFYVQSIVV